MTKTRPDEEVLAPEFGADGFALPKQLHSAFCSHWFENPRSFTNFTGVPSFSDVLKWKLTEKNNENTLDKEIPVHLLSKFESKSSFYAAWLGHATVLVHMEGANFLTDPIWATRASPLGLAGPARYRPPPMKIEHLPKIDFAVISHDHYDHLDEVSVRTISEQNPSMHWFVPLKMKIWMKKAGIKTKISELNWGDHETIQVDSRDFTIWCLPAQHWGQRGAFDRNHRLWSGWSVMGPTKKFFYTGDTGFCDDEFRKIGEKFGPFDLAAIPIGAYAPRWFMKNQHIDPHEAVQIHELVKSKRSLGIHWGTYHMGSYEFYLEPKQILEEVMGQKPDPGSFTTIWPGIIWEEKEEITDSTDEKPSNSHSSS